MTTTAERPTGPANQRSRTRHGAPLLPPAIAYAVLTVLAVVIPTVVAGFSPWSSDADLVAFFTAHHDAARLQALLTIGSAVPLAAYAAIISDRIRARGLQVPGRVIALCGGAVAAALLALSGATVYALIGMTDDAPSEAVLRFGRDFVTATGGIAFAAFVGLLAAGVAVTGLLGGLLPRPIAWLGVIVAAIGELAVLVSLTDVLTFLLPVTRFGTMLFFLAVAAVFGRE